MERVFLRVQDSDIFYRYLNFKFYFSSEAKRNRFATKVEKYSEEEIFKFMNKYEIKVNFESFKLMFAFILYNKIENRGIKIEQLLDERTVKRTMLEIPEFIIYGVEDNE